MDTKICLYINENKSIGFQNGLNIKENGDYS